MHLTTERTKLVDDLANKFSEYQENIIEQIELKAAEIVTPELAESDLIARIGINIQFKYFIFSNLKWYTFLYLQE